VGGLYKLRQCEQCGCQHKPSPPKGTTCKLGDDAIEGHIADGYGGNPMADAAAGLKLRLLVAWPSPNGTFSGPDANAGQKTKEIVQENLAEWESVPIVMVTALTNKTDLARCFAATIRSMILRI